MKFFFSAITFALDYSGTLETAPHEFKNFNGSVEIIFQNSNDAEKNQISIRRSVNNGGIEYFIDNAAVDRVDVKSFVSNLGFSQSYPFQYFTQRSDIEVIMNSNAESRLKLLLDCCGVDEFRKNRHKSERVLKEAKEHINKIDTSLKKIDVQLKIFASDENQKIYQEWMKRERELGHTQKQFQIKKHQQDIQKLNDDMVMCSAMMEKIADEIVKCAKELKIARQRIKSITTEIGVRAKRQTEIQSEMLELDAGRSTVSESIDRLRYGLERDRLLESHAKRESRLYRLSISQSESEATDMDMEIIRLGADEEDIRQIIGELEAQNEAVILNSEQNQRLKSQYLTVDERDEAISSEIKSIKSSIKIETRKANKLKNEIQMEITDMLEKLKANRQETTDKLNGLNATIAEQTLEDLQLLQQQLQYEVK